MYDHFETNYQVFFSNFISNSNENSERERIWSRQRNFEHTKWWCLLSLKSRKVCNLRFDFVNTCCFFKFKQNLKKELVTWIVLETKYSKTIFVILFIVVTNSKIVSWTRDCMAVYIFFLSILIFLALLCRRLLELTFWWRQSQLREDRWVQIISCFWKHVIFQSQVSHFLMFV